MPVPIRTGDELASIQQEAIRSCSVERGDAAFARLGLYLHRPATSSVAVIVTIRAQRVQFELDGVASCAQRETDIRRVSTLRHPNALFQHRIRASVGPGRNLIDQTKAVQV